MRNDPFSSSHTVIVPSYSGTQSRIINTIKSSFSEFAYVLPPVFRAAWDSVSGNIFAGSSALCALNSLVCVCEDVNDTRQGVIFSGKEQAGAKTPG